MSDNNIDIENESISESEDLSSTEQNSINEEIQDKPKKEKHHTKESKELELLKAQNEKLKNEKAELEDMIKRKVAEFDNYKKRVLKENDEFRITATKDLIIEFISVLDGFDRALASIDASSNIESIIEGIKIIHSQFKNIMSNHEVVEIPSENAEFDPNLHEAYMTEEVDDAEKSNKVLQVFEKGYKIGNTIIRHSKVKVGKIK